MLITFLIIVNIADANFSSFEKYFSFEDNFNRPNQEGLGEDWTSEYGKWSILNNTARSSMPAYFNSFVGYNSLTVKDGEVTVKFEANEIGYIEAWLGLQIRTESPGVGWWSQEGGSGYILSYGKDNDNKETLAFSNSYNIVWSKQFNRIPFKHPDELGIKFKDNNFKFYLDGIYQGEWTDPENLYSEGYAGMAVYNIKDARLDDFTLISS